jgi:hypothetical protein
MGLPAAQGTAAHNSNIAQNPDMSYSKSMAYMDSTLGYFCRRIVRATNLDGLAGLNDLISTESGINLFPNPANQNFTIQSDKGIITEVKIYSATGQLVKLASDLSANQVYIENLNLKEGLYLCSVKINGQSHTKRIIIE